MNFDICSKTRDEFWQFLKNCWPNSYVQIIQSHSQLLDLEKQVREETSPALLENFRVKLLSITYDLCHAIELYEGTVSGASFLTFEGAPFKVNNIRHFLFHCVDVFKNDEQIFQYNEFLQNLMFENEPKIAQDTLYNNSLFIKMLDEQFVFKKIAEEYKSKKPVISLDPNLTLIALSSDKASSDTSSFFDELRSGSMNNTIITLFNEKITFCHQYCKHLEDLLTKIGKSKIFDLLLEKVPELEELSRDKARAQIYKERKSEYFKKFLDDLLNLGNADTLTQEKVDQLKAILYLIPRLNAELKTTEYLTTLLSEDTVLSNFESREKLLESLLYIDSTPYLKLLSTSKSIFGYDFAGWRHIIDPDKYQKNNSNFFGQKEDLVHITAVKKFGAALKEVRQFLKLINCSGINEIKKGKKTLYVIMEKPHLEKVTSLSSLSEKLFCQTSSVLSNDDLDESGSVKSNDSSMSAKTAKILSSISNSTITISKSISDAFSDIMKILSENSYDNTKELEENLRILQDLLVELNQTKDELSKLDDEAEPHRSDIYKAIKEVNESIEQLIKYLTNEDEKLKLPELQTAMKKLAPENAILQMTQTLEKTEDTAKLEDHFFERALQGQIIQLANTDIGAQPDVNVYFAEKGSDDQSYYGLVSEYPYNESLISEHSHHHAPRYPSFLGLAEVNSKKDNIKLHHTNEFNLKIFNALTQFHSIVGENVEPDDRVSHMSGCPIPSPARSPRADD